MIDINIDPDLLNVGILNITWHGFFSVLGVALVVVLAARWAPRVGILPKVVYDTAVWAILGGIIGARTVHIADNWGFYSANPGHIFAIWAGGIALFGGILGAFLGAAIYTLISRYPLGRLADITAPAMLLAQFTGRIGDIINGEHCAKSTDLPFAFIYTHPASNAGSCTNGLGVPVHPVIGYEMIWDLIVFGILWNLRGRIAPSGMLFLLAIALYSLGRFAITFFRDDKVYGLGLQQAQIIALIVLGVAIPVLIYMARWQKRESEPAPEPPRRIRAARRRRR